MKIKKNPKLDECHVVRCRQLPIETVEGLGEFCHDHVAEAQTVKVPAKREDWKQEIETEKNDISEALEEAEKLEIETQEDVDFVQAELINIKQQWQQWEEKRKGITKPMNDALREVRALFKPVQDGLKSLESVLKRKLLQAKEREAAEQARLLAAASQAEKPEEVKAALIRASETRVEMPGASVIETWRWEVVDANAIPREYLIPDEKKINAVVRAAKENTNIPGVRTWVEKSLRQRTDGRHG